MSTIPARFAAWPPKADRTIYRRSRADPLAPAGMSNSGYRPRVDELTTAVAIQYTAEVTSGSLLDPTKLMLANAKSTNEKFLLFPAG